MCELFNSEIKKVSAAGVVTDNPRILASIGFIKHLGVFTTNNLSEQLSLGKRLIYAYSFILLICLYLYISHPAQRSYAVSISLAALALIIAVKINLVQIS